MTKINYKRRLAAVYLNTLQNGTNLAKSHSLETALCMDSPLREIAIVDWALGLTNYASSSVHTETRDPFSEWSL